MGGLQIDQNRGGSLFWSIYVSFEGPRLNSDRGSSKHSESLLGSIWLCGGLPPTPHPYFGQFGAPPSLKSPVIVIIYYPFNFQAYHKSEYCPGPSVTGPRRKRSQYWPWICAPGNTGMASHLGRRLMQMRNQYWPRAILQYCPRAILILEKRYIMLWRKHSAVALLVQSSKSTPLSVTESTAARFFFYTANCRELKMMREIGLWVTKKCQHYRQ